MKRIINFHLIGEDSPIDATTAIHHRTFILRVLREHVTKRATAKVPLECDSESPIYPLMSESEKGEIHKDVFEIQR